MMLNKKYNCILYFLIACITLISVGAVAQFILKDVDKYPYLIFDVIDNPLLPKQFRSSKSPYKKVSNVTRLGLDNLNISGSSQFTESSFKNMMNNLGLKTAYIIDLRQESHGFIDETPISWYGLKNAENEKKSNDEIFALENRLVQQLDQAKKAIVYKRLKENDHSTFIPEERSFKEATTEKTFVEKNGFHYFRIYVLDYHPPTDAQIDQFVQFVKTLPTDTWLHFHCHAGKGRTTFFMVLYDTIQNAEKVGIEDIMLRQNLLGGVNFFVNNPNKPWKIPLNKRRVNIMQAFHEYVLDKEGYSKRSWSEWLKLKALIL